jgi:hypothetical protein
MSLTGELLWPPPPDVAEGEEVAKPIPTPGPRLNGLLEMLASLSQYIFLKQYSTGSRSEAPVDQLRLSKTNILQIRLFFKLHSTCP